MGKSASSSYSKTEIFSVVNEPDALSLVDMVRQGVSFSFFIGLSKKLSFTLNEWSNMLHISERTMQRYQKDEKKFDPIYSEKIMQIALLYQSGVNVFGDKAKFDSWLEISNVALGGAKPKSLLDSSFGISLINDELIKIEHGIFA